MLFAMKYWKRFQTSLLNVIGRGVNLLLGFGIFLISRNNYDSANPLYWSNSFLSWYGLIGPLHTYVNQAVKGKDVCILFNNVAEFQHEAFADTSIETIFRASNVNCHAQAILSQFFLKKLISR